MASSPEDPLVAARVIGDVIDPFVPTMDLSVFFGLESVSTDTDIDPFMCKDPPGIFFNGIPDELYTLIMTDPDAPDPSEPSMREWIHWIVSDIPGRSDPIGLEGNEVLPYVPPQPLLGIHRCVLVLFQQTGPLNLVEKPSSRAGFSTRQFAQSHVLGLPVAAMYFRCPKGRVNRSQARIQWLPSSQQAWNGMKILHN